MDKQNVNARSLSIAVIFSLLLLTLAMTACNSSVTKAWQLSSESLSYRGLSGGEAPAEQTLTITNAGNAAQSFQLSASAPWLHASPTSGSLEAGAVASVTVTVDACPSHGTESATLSIGGAAAASVAVERICDPAAGELTWARQTGTENYDDAGGRGSLAATDDRVYVGGGGDQLYLAVYDTAGEKLWETILASSEQDVVIQALAPAADGGVYAAGSVYGYFELPGHNTTSSGRSDAFLARLSSAGELEWFVQFGTPEYDDLYGLAVDLHGNVIVSGSTEGDFDDDQASSNGYQAFVASFTPSGSQSWLEQLSSSESFVNATSLGVDDGGNIYIGGVVDGDLPGNTSSGGQDVFAAKYSTSGTRLWVRQLGTSEWDSARILVAAGGVYLGGSTYGAFPGFSNQGTTDAFVARYDGDGNSKWLYQFGTSSNDGAGQLACDEAGNLYVAGNTVSSNDPNDREIFLSRYDASTGNLVWNKNLGTEDDDDEVHGLVYAGGQLLLTGRVHEPFDGQPEIMGSSDIFVASFGAENGELAWLNQFGSQPLDTNHNYLEWPAGMAVGGGFVYVSGSTNGLFPGETLLGENDLYLAQLKY
ncbi:SBBP repeat-containing protein [Oceanithermus sp.]